MQRLALVAMLAGCIEHSLERCRDLLCPAGTTCVSGHTGCHSTAAVAACASSSDGETCSIGGFVGGTCYGGVCFEPGCGNGVIDGADDCEGTDLGGLDCVSLGFDAGALGCTAECRFDTTGCAGICGDGVRDLDEACDGDDLGTASCRTLGYYDPGPLSCTAACTFSDDACTGICGDLTVNGPELCDASLPARSCADVGFDMGPTTCTLICGVDFEQCRDIGWEPVLSASGGLTELAARGPDDIYAGGSGLFHFDGSSWTKLSTSIVDGLWVDTGGLVYAIYFGTLRVFDGAMVQQYSAPSTCRDVWGRSPTEVYLVGDVGKVYRFNGSSFVLLDTGVTDRLNAVAGTASVLYAVGANGRIVRLDQSGWTPMLSNTTATLDAVWVDASGEAYAVGDGGTILHHVDGTWKPIASPVIAEFGGVWGTGVDDVYVTGWQYDRAVILHWNGSSWRELVLDSPSPIGDVWGTSSEVYTVSIDGAALRSQRIDWAVIPPQPEAGTASGAFVDESGTVITLKQSAGAFRHDASGWTQEYPGGGYFLGMWATSKDDIYVVGPAGSGGFFAHYDGLQWTEYPAIGAPTFYDAWGVAPGNVYVVGSSGAFYHFNGLAVAALPSPADVELRAVWAASATDVFAAGAGGRIFRYQNGAWSEMSSGVTTMIFDLWGSGPSDVHAVGEAGLLLHFDGTTWAPQVVQDATFDTIRAVSGTGPSDVFAAGTRLLYHFDGSIWSPVRLLGARDYSAVHATLKSVVLADDNDKVDVLVRSP